ncbi:MAG: hypothetical protein LBM77_12880 [Spirochaetaceae bacterium]|jgi:hypothetical protein|nr:hypothetical protein [Spirochaetaceae bacterium]
MLKKSVFVLIIIIIVFQNPLFAQAADRAYYVSALGNDENNGRSEQSAFRTLEKAVERSANGTISTIIVIGNLNLNKPTYIKSTGGREILITGKDSMEKLRNAKIGNEINISHNSILKFENISLSTLELLGYYDNFPTTLILGDGAVVSDVENSMAAVNITDGILTLAGASIKNNKCSGIYLNKSKLVIDDGLITDNIIDKNNAFSSNGAGIYAFRDSSIVMNSGKIQNNAKYYRINPSYYGACGGGVCIEYGCSFEMNAGLIENNLAEGFGGGIFVSNGGSFIMNGGTIKNNIAKKDGGGLWGDCLIRNGSISSNQATRGGGIYSNTRNRIINGTISDNQAEYGAGIYIEDDRFTASGGKIENNSAEFVGGGIYIRSGALLVQDGSTIINNIAGDGEGENIFRQ